MTAMLASLPAFTNVGYSGTKQDRQITWSTLGNILHNDCPRLKSPSLTGLVLVDNCVDNLVPLDKKTRISDQWWVYASLTSPSLSRTRLSIETLCRLSGYFPNLHAIEVCIIGYNPPLEPFDDLPEPPAGLQPLKFKEGHSSLCPDH